MKLFAPIGQNGHAVRPQDLTARGWRTNGGGYGYGVDYQVLREPRCGELLRLWQGKSRPAWATRGIWWGWQKAHAAWRCEHPSCWERGVKAEWALPAIREHFGLNLLGYRDVVRSRVYGPRAILFACHEHRGLVGVDEAHRVAAHFLWGGAVVGSTRASGG